MNNELGLRQINPLTVVALAEEKTLDDIIIQRHHFKRLDRRERLKMIYESVCEIYRVSPADMKGARKKEEISYIRYIYYYIAWLMSDCYQDWISALTARERSCVSQGTHKVQAWLDRPYRNPRFIACWNQFAANAPKYIIPEEVPPSLR